MEINLAAVRRWRRDMAPPGMEDDQPVAVYAPENPAVRNRKPRKLKIKDAMKLLAVGQPGRAAKQDAIDAVEQHGIVFIG